MNTLAGGIAGMMPGPGLPSQPLTAAADWAGEPAADMHTPELLPHLGLLAEGGMQEYLDGLQAGTALDRLGWLGGVHVMVSVDMQVMVALAEAAGLIPAQRGVVVTRPRSMVVAPSMVPMPRC